MKYKSLEVICLPVSLLISAPRGRGRGPPVANKGEGISFLRSQPKQPGLFHILCAMRYLYLIRTPRVTGYVYVVHVSWCASNGQRSKLHLDGPVNLERTVV